MNKNLTCSQVLALINFYIDNKLNPTLKEYIDMHLLNCPNCRKKFEELKNIIQKYSNNSTQEQPLLSKEFIHNLSAYVDNELDSGENIKIKKQTVANPHARRELEYMYKFQKLMQQAYEKTKNDYKSDYSKEIVLKISDGEYYTTTYFKKLIVLFCIIIGIIIAGFIYLYF